jgi:hypothetical protein
MEQKYQIGDIVKLIQRRGVSPRSPLQFSVIRSVNDRLPPVTMQRRGDVSVCDTTPILIVGHSVAERVGREVYFILINNALSYASVSWMDEYTYKVEKSE